MTRSRVYFEPWGMGDALIAAAIMRLDSRPCALACHARWIPLLRSAVGETGRIELIPTDLPYTTRARTSRFDMGVAAGGTDHGGVREVLSIRGDPRDYRAARRLFPNARLRMAGWLGFLARRSPLVDLPFAMGLLPVVNRYRAWSDLARVPFPEVASELTPRPPAHPPGAPVVIHFGAQWRSRQYPHLAQLVDLIEEAGLPTLLAAGPFDALPDGVQEGQVRRVWDAELVATLRAARLVVTNDSGPMHLAAFLGLRTVALARTANLDEWLPCGVHAIRSPRMPGGYRPDRRYATDLVLDGWVHPRQVARTILDQASEAADPGERRAAQ